MSHKLGERLRLLTSPRFVLNCAGITGAIAITYAVPYWDVYSGQRHVEGKELRFSSAKLEVTHPPKGERRVNVILDGDRVFHSSCRGLLDSICSDDLLGKIVPATDLVGLEIERRTGVLFAGSFLAPSGELRQFENLEAGEFIRNYRDDISQPVDRTLLAACILAIYGFGLKLRNIRRKPAISKE